MWAFGRGGRLAVSNQCPQNGAPRTVPQFADLMTSPWMPDDSCHCSSIAFSVPEITTVSNPRRNPASDAVKDQKTRRGFKMPTGCL